MLFLYGVFFLSIIILILAGIVAAAFVIPLQVKEVRVRNGLAKLRKQLLFKGALAFGTIAIAIVVLSLRYVINDLVTLRYITVSLVLLYAFVILAQTYIDYVIYRQNYTPENKRIHEKVEAIEKANEKREAEAQA